jgi:hypothetical protein
MRIIDTIHMDVLHRGKKWLMETDPCSKDMMKHLERNESVISWLKPRGGCIEDIIPAIMVGNEFCPLSLRMMKAVWRHVRLKKGFSNVEPLSQGGFKLKIPHVLMKEKIRTQTRFNVMTPPCLSSCYNICIVYQCLLLQYIYIYK